MDRIRVLIVEDNPLIAEDIATCLNEIDYEVIGIAYDMEMALDALNLHKPDTAILDVNLNGELDGIKIGHEINEKFHIPFIYLTSYADRSTIEQIKPTRPYGYVVKPFDSGDLLSSLEIAIFNHAQRHLPRLLSLTKVNESLLSHLTQKEFEVLKSIYDGKTNGQMAEEMFVSVNTIKTHIKSIYEKLDTRSRVSTLAKLRVLLGS